MSWSLPVLSLSKGVALADEITICELNDYLKFGEELYKS